MGCNGRISERLVELVPHASRISSGAPEPLVLHKLVSSALVQKCIDDNLLAKQSWEWHIGLRQTAEVAVSRAFLFEDHISKDSHVMLRVTFTPLGVALFASTFTDGTNNFRPILSKKVVSDDKDWGVWHFLQDLPLSLSTPDGEPLISSEWLEIL